MQIEFDVEAVSSVDFANPWATDEKEEPKLSFHEKIFSPPFYPVPMSREVELEYLHSLESKKTDTFVKGKLSTINRS
jgi:hypothetical protein